MRILHLDKNHPLLVNQLTAAGHINDEDYTITKAETEKIIGMYDGIVIRSRFPIDRLFIDAATNLKFIARVGAGLESVDVAYAQQKGIHLISSPEGNRNAVGEHALGMLLNLFNNLNRSDRQVKTGQWNREMNRGIELEGKTVGIIGYGNMGQAFAKKLLGFDCTVLCYDIKANVGNEHAQQVDFATFTKEVDVVSLHTPWTPETNEMVDAQFINAFAKAFYFINTARGKSVVTKDLVTALQQGKIAGAGLDVLEYENLSFENLFIGTEDMPAPLQYLIKQDNVLLSPHIAGWTVESKVKLSQTIVTKILQLF